MSIRIYQMKDHYISLDHARYDTSIVTKYLDTATFKASTNFYKTKFPSDMIFTKDYTSTSDEQVEKFTREFNIHYIFFVDLFIVYKSSLEFSVHNIDKFSSNPGKVHCEGLIHLLGYIGDNKT